MKEFEGVAAVPLALVDADIGHGLAFGSGHYEITSVYSQLRTSRGAPEAVGSSSVAGRDEQCAGTYVEGALFGDVASIAGAGRNRLFSHLLEVDGGSLGSDYLLNDTGLLDIDEVNTTTRIICSCQIDGGGLFNGEFFRRTIVDVTL